MVFFTALGLVCARVAVTLMLVLLVCVVADSFGGTRSGGE